jgi:hypothetical protein
VRRALPAWHDTPVAVAAIGPQLVPASAHPRLEDHGEHRHAVDVVLGRSPRARLFPPLIAGVCVDVPLGTAFQYRCTGDVPLVFTCTAMPPWPGDDEALLVEGPWVPSVGAEPPRAEPPRASS